MFSFQVFKNSVKHLGLLAVTVMKYGCIIHCVTKYGVSFVVCDGISMQPTIQPGDVYLVESVSVYRHRLERGDIVGVKSHNKRESYIGKRIIGMEGDKIFNAHTREYVWVPRGHVWLEGDNKKNSLDSREYGALPYGLIYCRLVSKIWSSSVSYNTRR